MRPLRTRMQEARKKFRAPWDVLERDYLLSWILAGMSQTESLQRTLVFKGGTALKKCFFGNYRFSEDLDFSGLAATPTDQAMDRAIAEACETAARLLDEYAPVAIECRRYTEKDSHRGGQQAFTIRGKLPWHRQPQTRLMVEITMDETIVKPVRERKIIHEYGEPLNASIQTYALEEIVAEKLRAILQHAKKLEQRGWSRSRARDYYDIWRILSAYEADLDFSGFPQFLRKKCALRRVSFNGPDDFFQDAMLRNIDRTWERWLGPLVPDLPPFDFVIGEVRPRIVALLA